MLIKSKIKYIQSLSQKKARDAEKLFIAEGQKIVSEFLTENAAQIQSIYAVAEWIELNQDILADFKGEINTIELFELEKISQLKTPNQVLALVKNAIEEKLILKGNEWGLILDDIQDPGNLGTIIRIADWFGVKHIVCSKETVDCYNNKVVQSTMASLLRVNIVYTNLAEWISYQKNVTILGAFLEGESIYKMEIPAGGWMIIGNESKGISEKLASFVQQKITIPQIGKAESLNAAVATGIILSHFTKK